MSKRELNIPNKRLYENTKEDIILKSPFRIPPKGIQDLISLKGVNITDYAYYDIAKTENQAIHFNDILNRFNIQEGYIEEELNILMGEFEDL